MPDRDCMSLGLRQMKELARSAPTNRVTVRLDGTAGAVDTVRVGLTGQDVTANLDVSDAAACQAFAGDARAALGPVSILVNNAGVIHRDRFDAPEFAANWDRTFRINVDGARNMTLAALGDLRATGGRVVNLGSILSLRGAASAISYAATKGAIAQFTRSLAAELAPEGVRVNALAPGVIATQMTAPTRENPEALARFMAHTPMGRVGTPEELVGPVLFLVSQMSSYVTGVVLPVDGGYVAI